MLVANTQIMVGSSASSKGWGQMQEHKKLQWPWLYTTVGAESCYGCMAVNTVDGSQAGGIQLHSSGSSLQVSPVVREWVELGLTRSWEDLGSW